MKLGISYVVFEGEELLPFLLPIIRPDVDFISICYQELSYYGEPASPDLLPLLHELKAKGLIDQLILFEQNLSYPRVVNEINCRNLGIIKSRQVGCTHHISADVDEFYDPTQLRYAKKVMEEEEYECSIASLINYYKDPTYMIVPSQGHMVSLIQSIDCVFDINTKSKVMHHIDPTRKPVPNEKCRVFLLDEIVMHHMTFVRKNIRKKVMNSSNFYRVDREQFLDTLSKYKLGERFTLPPDFKNRRTIRVENKFGINLGE